jgi:regulator of sigma E protease
MGFKDGDKIISVDGERVESLNKVPIHIILNKATSVQIERDGKQISIPISEEDISHMINSKSLLFSARIPSEVDSVLPGKNAEKAGIQKGDRFLSINDIPTPYHIDVQRNIQKNKGKTISSLLLRGNDTIKVTMQVSEEGTVGFVNKSPDNYLNFRKIEYGFLESFPAGFREGYEKIIMQAKQLVILFTVKDAHKSLGGFYSIASAYDPGWSWQVFWTFTAFLSVVLAFMNFLPIPALDGGYIMFLLFEMITRIKVPDRVIEYANYVGFAILIALMLYANTDFIRH